MLAYIHIQKTAGQTMRAILRKNFGARHCDTLVNENIHSRDWRWIKFCYPHLTSLAGHGVKITPQFQHQFPQARYYTTLRDPFTRCVSRYQYHCERSSQKKEFRTWLTNNSNRMCEIICGEENAEQAIEFIETKIQFVGLMERFDESLLLWNKWTGISGLDLTYQSTNKAKSNQIKSQILNTPGYPELIQECHTQDQKLYEYVRDNVFPRQIHNYGDSLKNDLQEFTLRQESASNSSWGSVIGKVKRNLIFRPGTQLSKAA